MSKDSSAKGSKLDPKAAEQSGTSLAEAEGAEDEAKPRSWKRWVLGWVIAPGSVLGSIWLGGVVVGAHFSESWFARAVIWMVELF